MSDFLFDLYELEEHGPIQHTYGDKARDTLENLSQKDQDLLEARFYERLTYRQMAKRFGWRYPESARWALSKAMERFKKEFGDYVS